MKRALITVFASLLAVALIAPAAQGATQFRQVQTAMTMPATSPGGIIYVPAGTLTLDFVFKNTRGNKKKFTPRQLTRIDFESVPLLCYNAPVNPTGTSQLLLTTTLETRIKVKKTPPPGPKPKPGRYAFDFFYSFPASTGTISGKIDKVTGAAKPRPPRSQGEFAIEDLDSGPDQWDCSTTGRRNWGGPLTAP